MVVGDSNVKQQQQHKSIGPKRGRKEGSFISSSGWVAKNRTNKAINNKHCAGTTHMEDMRTTKERKKLRGMCVGLNILVPCLWSGVLWALKLSSGGGLCNSAPPVRLVFVCFRGFRIEQQQHCSIDR